MTKYFQISYGFIAISDHNPAQNVFKLNSERAKEFTFKRSVKRQWLFRRKTGCQPTFTTKNGKHGQKYVLTVIDIRLPPQKLHSGARWQMKDNIGHRYFF